MPTIIETLNFKPETLQEVQLIKTAGLRKGLKFSTSFIARAAIKLLAETVLDMEASGRNWSAQIKELPGSHISRKHTMETRLKMRNSQQKRFHREKEERDAIIEHMKLKIEVEQNGKINTGQTTGTK